MATDGNFKWWYGHGKEPEIFYGPCDTRDEAVAQGEAENEHGFTICEADKATARPHFFDADWVMEQYGEANEECWGEDGPEFTVSKEQERELELMLGDAFKEWLDKIGKAAPRVWAFGEIRNTEYFAPAQGIEARSGETALAGSPSCESPVREANAPPSDLDPKGSP